MPYYNKDALKEQLTTENIYSLLQEFGGNPQLTSFGLVADTICHNLPGEGSRKLYFYKNSDLFQCFTDCGNSFDVFELVQKVMKIQQHKEYKLYDCMHFVAAYFGLSGDNSFPRQDNVLDVFNKYDFKKISNEDFPLEEYDMSLLKRFLYPRILPWEQEGISKEVIKKNYIGYYPKNEQITIPHFNKNGKLIGLRGRALCEDDAERFGKYRPIEINKKYYSHPLSMNLYNLNNSKNAINKVGAAIIVEGEKSCLLSQTFYDKNDITVACCGSSVSSQHIKLLLDCGAREIIIAFDRQFQEIGDNEFHKLKNKILSLKEKYENKARISAIFDKEMITPYKASPFDCGKEVFEKLLKERIRF